MANDGQIVFEVTADGKHAIADIKDITRAIQNETKNWDKAAEESADNINNQFSGMLKKLVAGFSAVKVGKALLDIGKDAIEAASALEEVQNVVDVTFGGNANKIDTWAKNAGTQFGLTETQAKKFTSTLGAMMKSSGIAGDEIVGMSTDLSGLAADMASFYNLDFEEAFQKIRSGISGETEPLKQLGINMSVANLEAYALSKGISKAFKDMSQGEQTMLRYQYMMEATADAQGDFARTSDGYANSLRQMETNIEGIKTALGKTFIDVVKDATGLLNGFIQSLMPEEKPTTVLDDFAAIDLKTEEKLAQIEATAEQARELTEELDKIGGSKADKAGSKVQGIAESLGKINLDQGKAGVVKDFISTLANNIDILASIQGTDAEGAKEWLESIGKAADSLSPEDAEGWKTLIDSIKEGLPGLENTDFGAAFFGALGEGFQGVSEKSSVLSWVVSSLGDKTDKTAQEQALWLETCKRLVQTIPGLSAIINTETGEIKGGTDAVKAYIKAWEDGQKKLALLGAVEQKEAALSSRFGDLPGLELDMAVAERRVRKSFEQLQGLYAKYGLKLGIGKDGKVVRNFSDVYGITKEDIDNLNKETDYFETLVANAETARNAYQMQKDALEEAKQALIEYRQAIEDEYGSVDAAIAAGVEWSETVKENAKVIVDVALGALDDLGNHYEKALTKVEEAVNSVADGFNKLDYMSFGKSKDKITELVQSMAGLKVGSDEWKKINAQVEKLNEELVSTDNIYKALESQETFLDDYLKNLDKAQQMGLSNEMLAMLSDGSVESAQYLSALVNDQSGKTAQQIDELFQKVQEKKKTLSKALTDQQLTVDEVYQNLQAQAKAAVDALDMEGLAEENTGKTVAGLARGIASHVPEVKSAVDEILVELARLEAYGINVNLGGKSIPILTPTASNGAQAVIGSFEVGLDRVPFDGFLASLHEGEGILTAEENRIWQQFKNGGNGVDYDAMGGVIRDNSRGGGNVYLDGRVVGSVISDQQGRSYRQLQRSGWQG